MPAPRMTDEDLSAFLTEPGIAKLASHNPDGTIRVAPLWFKYEDGKVVFSTWPWTKAAQNIARDSGATVMIDTTEMPYKGIHMVGTAELGPESTDPEAFGRWFGSYTGSEESGLAYAQELIEMGGPRVDIVFTPERDYNWDFAQS